MYLSDRWFFIVLRDPLNHKDKPFVFLILWFFIALRAKTLESLGPPFLDIVSHPDFATAEVEEARSSSECRRMVLKRYRNNVVLPALRERDLRLYLFSGSTVIPSL